MYFKGTSERSDFYYTCGYYETAACGSNTGKKVRKPFKRGDKMKKRLKDVWKPMLIVAFFIYSGQFPSKWETEFYFIWQQSV